MLWKSKWNTADWIYLNKSYREGTFNIPVKRRQIPPINYREKVDNARWTKGNTKS